jgi:hypothetical protein
MVLKLSHFFPMESTLFPHNDAGFPSRTDLFNALENILWFWPEIFLQSVPSQEPPKGLTLSRTVRLTGTHEGLVVFRGTPELGTLLAKKLLQFEGTGSYSEDAFSEFVNMFCGHLMAKIRDQEKGSFRHFLPLELPEQDWPQETPDANLVVGVANHLLEIRLWLTLAQETLRGRP